MLKLGCTPPNLGDLCLQKSTIAKFYRFIESDSDLFGQMRSDMLGGPSSIFTRKTVVDETSIKDSRNWCHTIVGIEASQLYPFSFLLASKSNANWSVHKMGARFVIWQIKPRQNKTRCFEHIVMSYLQRVLPQCKVEKFYTTGTQNTLMHIVLMAFVDAATLCLKPWVAIIIIVLAKKFVLPSLRKKFSMHKRERATLTRKTKHPRKGL